MKVSWEVPNHQPDSYVRCWMFKFSMKAETFIFCGQIQLSSVKHLVANWFYWFVYSQSNYRLY